MHMITTASGHLSQERLTPSWITACLISITPKYYILLPSLSVLAAVLLGSSVVGHAMLSRHLILAGRGILLGKDKQKEKKIIMMMMIVKKQLLIFAFLNTI